MLAPQPDSRSTVDVNPARHASAEADRFRDTVQRWTFESGRLAGVACDYAFHVDGSLDWRMVAGAQRGLGGRAREFRVRPAGPWLFFVAFAPQPGVVLAAAVDFRARRVVGLEFGGGDPQPFAATMRTL